MKRVIITKGLPASGKSTWAKAQIDANPGVYKRISKDDLRSMLDNGRWSKANEKFILQVRDTLILQSLQEGYRPIVDDTNLHPKHIDAIQELVKGIAIIEIKDFTDVSLEECIARDKKRANYVGEQVIRRMYRDFLQPVSTPPAYNYNLPNAVLCDIDGTLALFDRKTVNAYSRDFLQDTPNRAVRMFLSRSNTTIILLTGRQEKDREQTELWLNTHDIDYQHLYMRQTDDKRSDYIVKLLLYNEHIRDKYNILAVFDDRLSVCRLWFELGLPLFRVGDPDADF